MTGEVIRSMIALMVAGILATVGLLAVVEARVCYRQRDRGGAALYGAFAVLVVLLALVIWEGAL